MAASIGITGVTGFIGSALASDLARDGHRVVGFSRDRERAQRAVPSLTEVRSLGSGRSIEPAALSGLDALVSLAGESVAGRWSEEKKRRIASSRIDGTRRLVDALAAMPEDQRPSTFVSGSAIGFYGDTGQRVVDETTEPGHDFLAEVSVGWEREAMRARELGIRTVAIRTGLVMGRGGGALERMLPLFRAGLGGRLGGGDQYWAWIHLEDVVGIIRHAIENASVEGPLNATAPRPVPQHEFASTLARELHRPAFLPAPEFALKLALGEFSSEILSSHRVLPARTLASGYVFRRPELGAALRSIVG